MSKIKIITDASATLPENVFNENDVGVVDLKIIWLEEDIDGDLFKKMRNTLTNTSPKTSQPSRILKKLLKTLLKLTTRLFA